MKVKTEKTTRVFVSPFADDPEFNEACFATEAATAKGKKRPSPGADTDSDHTDTEQPPKKARTHAHAHATKPDCTDNDDTEKAI